MYTYFLINLLLFLTLTFHPSVSSVLLFLYCYAALGNHHYQPAVPRENVRDERAVPQRWSVGYFLACDSLLWLLTWLGYSEDL